MTPRALLSVSDKTGVTGLGRALVERGWELLSTGGTARILHEAGLPVTGVAEATAHPEMMEGRVKTLHPAIHAGLLARREVEGDMEALRERGYAPIDLVAVNLYPFRETIAAGGVAVKEAMEEVDIGGPAMIRAAAKNHASVWVVVDPGDYPAVIEALDAGDAGERGGGEERRRALAAKVFAHVGAYDRAVARFLGGEGGGSEPAEASATGEVGGPGDETGDAPLGEEADGPAALPLPEGGPGPTPSGPIRVSNLRYGENPDQEAAFHAPAGERFGVAALERHHGKKLSYNNILDLDGALLALSPFAFSPRPAVCIVKHATPCGLAVGDTLEDAYRRALATDPSSAFGSVIAVNRPVDGSTAEAMSELFIECVVAPAFEESAFGTLSRKKNLRLLTPSGSGPREELVLPGAWRRRMEAIPAEFRAAACFIAAHGRLPHPQILRSVYGGMLAQSPPLPPLYPGTGEGSGEEGWSVPSPRQPSPEEWDDLRFAWAVVFGVKSNAIVLAREGATLGVGGGQTSRVDSSRIAVRKAKEAGLRIEGSVLASDGFFPFRDGVDAAAGAGVRAIVQPGGSRRDGEVIEAAAEHGIAMVFTGRRLFRH